ncbi:hypothetical protein AX14_014097 [Amanita brunnescens Koide BX004]|nr:hypothetical protein AX14_014097 [Amanita brunnescens Koide BX004]
MIERYKAHMDEGGEPEESTGELADDKDEADSLTEGLIQLPQLTDPSIWSVRTLEGMALDAFFVLQDRLLHWPQHKRSALSVFLPSGSTQWLAIESTSMANVQHLCLNVSSIRHPHDISLIPVDQ